MLDWMDGLTGLDVLTVLCILALLVFMVFGAGQTVQGARAESECLRRGWSGYTLTWNFRAYCHRRVDQTDVVAPLDSLRRVR